MLDLSGMLINDNHLLSYPTSLPPTFVPFLGAGMLDTFEKPLPMVSIKKYRMHVYIRYPIIYAAQTMRVFIAGAKHGVILFSLGITTQTTPFILQQLKPFFLVSFCRCRFFRFMPTGSN